MADKEVTNCSCDFRIEGESGVYKGMFLKDSPTVLNTCQITDYYLCRAICYSQVPVVVRFEFDLESESDFGSWIPNLVLIK